MSLLDAVAPLCQQTVTVEPYASQDAYGAETYGSPVTYQARVVGKVRRITAASGEERVSTVTVYLVDSTGLTTRDRVTLPDGWTPSQPTILAVARVPDASGAEHEVLYA